ncbi:MAG: hypothetical protein R3D60_03420 [Paracoccaceae bacterium]
MSKFSIVLSALLAGGLGLSGPAAFAQQGGMQSIEFGGATWVYTATQVGVFGPEHAAVGHRGMTGPSVTYTFHSRNGAPLGTADFRDADKIALQLCLASGRGFSTGVPPRLSSEGVLTIAGACSL